METKGYDIGSATVWSKHGSPLKSDELMTIVCAVCGFVLREAMQVTQCGHRFCKHCIEKITKESSDSYRCPIDQEKFEKVEVKRDRGVQREIDSLEVDCPTRPDPCPWRGPLVEIEVHQLKCPHALVSCTLKCGLSLRRDRLESHLGNDCTKRLVICPHCNQAFQSDSLNIHFLECLEFPVECEHCNKKLPNRKSVQKHLQNDCSNYQMDCPMKCSDFKGKQPSMIKHLTTHLLDIVNLLNTTMSRVEQLEAKQQESIASLTHRLEEVTTEKREFKRQISEMERSVKTISHRVDALGTNESQRATNHHTQPKSILPLNYSHVAATKFEVRENAGIREQVQTQGTHLIKMSETLQTVQTNITQYAIAMDEVRLRQDILDVKVTNGLMIWKIPDMRRRYRDAVDRRTISLYSPPFYTSPHGYRMCIRTYLNGDGIGKGTHLSLFLVVMCSEQDNLLPWPFKQRVRFTLVNQKNESASITEAFVPDTESPSFKKPESEMNVASGFPKFARQSVLQDEEFTLGNTIFIKCQVDTAGLKLE